MPSNKKSEVHLTPRQKEILSLSSEGKTYAQIAEELDISYGTVRAHLAMIREKLNVTSTVGAALVIRNSFLGT